MFLSGRPRLIVPAVFLVLVVGIVMEFGTVSQAFTGPLLAPAMTATNGNPIFTNAATGGIVSPASKIAPFVITDTAEGKKASVVVFLTEQASVSAANDIADHDARGWYVYNTLTEHADRTQAGIKAMLQSEGVAYQSFWVANMLVAEADRTLVERLAERSDVARVDSNRPARWIERPEIADERPASSVPDAPGAIEWGVDNVNAPAVWALGFTGQGIVVGGLDTGIRWSHNVLKNKYRGWNGTTADHNYNWHDAIHSGGGVCGANTTVPCDDNGHGTHTVGTMVGEDASGNQVGVAPGAKWMGCRNMNVGDGTPATYTECFQFTIAPTDSTGNNPDPTLRPHVLNNSWGCPASEGCTTRAELETIVTNTQDAGIFVEVSAGNSGPGCSSVSEAPAIYSNSFSTGAINSSNTVASFSSRGPSTYYNPALLKPNISAPGVNVRSATRSSDTAFSSLSGTSMAGPHVAGVVALLWSARPQLIRNIAETKEILQNTANPGVTVAAQTCGGIPSTQIPNNSFGYGRVDALAAVNAVGAGTPTPTATPSATPTTIPTATATSTPTATPTLTPTPTPTATPTVTPTPFPSSGTIAPGQTVNGTLQTGDCLINGGMFYDAYTFNGTAGQRINIRMNSSAIDPFLVLYRGSYPGGIFVTQDNDSGSGTNARIPSAGYLTLSTTGTYTVLASTIIGGSGTYSLSMLGSKAPVSDFDGDRRSDISVFRPSNGSWYLQQSTAGFTGLNFGLATDKIAPADYDGDGKADVAIYRPSEGTWYIANSSNGTYSSIRFGTAEDLPAPADYDGDSRADLAVFRPSVGTWFIVNSSNGRSTVTQFGQLGDRPTVGDFDGDGRADIAVYRPSSGIWYRLNSEDNVFFAEQFGISTDTIVPADFDGDGETDLGVYRPDSGTWFIRNSETGSLSAIAFGLAQDIPAPGDYDGDGLVDLAVFRPSNGVWYIANSSNATFTIFQFGMNGDRPTESALGE